VRAAWLRAALLACLTLFAWLPARADTALSVFQSFRGSVNFTGTEVTLRAYANDSSSYSGGYYGGSYGSTSSSACQLVRYGTATATLKGIPTGATILSAQLYWAGSGNTVDTSVYMDGNTVTAGRSYQSTTIGNGNNYFSAAADVTAAVKQKGNNTYTFSGLSVNTGSPWCDRQGVVAGFALAVVYSSSSEPFRMLNIYEGFQYFRNSGLTINLGNFNVPNPLPSNVTGRVGHITWEGDSTLSGGGESLLFNSTELTDSMNPAGNQFNSQSNINGDAYSYGIDFDAYTLTASNGTIVPGSNTATTTYKTGQDLVLLSAEIVAMPYVANADLALSMTRTGDLTVNSTASYTFSVANKGVDAEVGPVTIVDTLPAGLKAISYSGSGWSCAAAAGSNGATVVTCSHNGPLAPSATMSSLTLNVTATASGNYTNTATVSGATGDDNSSNNTVSNTYTQPATVSASSAVFTSESCTSGQKIVVAADVTGCHKFTGFVIAGANGSNNVPAKNIYLTSVGTDSSGNQVATAGSTSSAPVTINFTASCAPNSGVNVTYAGLTLDCKGTAQSVSMPGNLVTASSSPVFMYADVGTVTLSALYGTTPIASITLVSRPWDIGVRDVIRASDGYSDSDPAPRGVSPNFTRPDTGFARAGDPFTLRLGAIMANSTSSNMQWAPSFGKEPGATLQFQLDRFAVQTPLSAPVLPLASTSTLPDIAQVDTAVRNAFVYNQRFAPSTDPNAPSGSIDASVSYFEAGNLAVTPYLVDYLNTGPVGKAPPDRTATPDATAARLTLGTRVIGRFYPDRLQTVAIPKFACLPAMNCPAAYDATTPAWPVKGAVYSIQPFTVKVNAFGLVQDPTVQQLPLAMFQNVAGTRTVGVSAVAAPNGSTARTGLALSPVLPVSSGAADFPTMATSATMKLATSFDAAKRLASNWTAPTFFYLRASMSETRALAGGTTQSFTINSIAPATADPGTTYEDGLLAVNGRLQVANAIGAEALRLPVGLTAQYWSGSAWLVNSNDGDSQVAANAPVSVTTAMFCTRAFASTTTTPTATPMPSNAGNCKSGQVTSSSSGTAIRLNNGKGTLVLQQPSTPGRLNGTIDYQVGGGDSKDWLPSTLARASFGLYKAPVIYVREVY
jgi:MSHA biogenesis protein MshQ